MQADAVSATATPKLAPKPIKEDFLGVNRQDRVHVFIDANNLLGMLRTINQKIDFKLFMRFLRDQTRLVRASYFVLMREEMEQRAERVIDMIEFAGFDVYRKWGKEFQENAGHFSFRGTIIPEMTVAMIDAADSGADHIVLISGDGEMLAAVEAVKLRETRVTIIGREDSMSVDLRKSCDAFVDLASLRPAGFFFS